MKKKFTYDYPRPAVAVDIVIVTRKKKPRVLLIRRKHEPFAGMWSIPGGHVEMKETLEAADRRELFEETGMLGSPQGLQAIYMQKGNGDVALIQGSWFISIRDADHRRAPTKQNHLRVSNLQDGSVAETDTEALEWLPVQELG